MREAVDRPDARHERGEAWVGLNLPAGCPFAPRCGYATDPCRTIRPERTPYPRGRAARCHNPLNVSAADAQPELAP